MDDTKDRASSLFSFLQKDIRIFNKGITDKSKERFYNDLYVLLSSGVDIRTALELFKEEQTKKSDQEIYSRLMDFIVKGKSLSGAMVEMKHFSNYECVSIKIGEETGYLSEILKQLSSYFAKRIKLKRQMMSVFSYPLFLLTVTFGVLYFMLNNVVPMFADVFQRFGKELPPFTQKIIHLSTLVRNYGPYILLMALTCIALHFYVRRNPTFRKISASLVLKSPIFGKLIHKIYLARFCQSMQLLVTAKIPLVEALSLVEKMIEFYPLEHALRNIQQQLTQGKTLHQGMSEYSIFEKRMVSLIRVSEEVNSLETMFGRLSAQYNDEVEYRTSIMGSLIEPLMILIIGLIVGVILVAMYQPLFNISNILE